MGYMEILQNIAQKDIFFAILFLFGAQIVILILLALIFIKLRKISVKSKEFFSGKDGKSLENLILDISRENKAMDKEIQELYNISNHIHKLTIQSVRQAKMIRFNPFKDIGGEQSFSAVWLNGKNSGMIISSLHTKEGTRVYAKNIVNGKSPRHPLTEEEKRVLQEATEDNSGLIAKNSQKIPNSK